MPCGFGGGYYGEQRAYILRSRVVHVLDKLQQRLSGAVAMVVFVGMCGVVSVGDDGGEGVDVVLLAHRLVVGLGAVDLLVAASEWEGGRQGECRWAGRGWARVYHTLANRTWLP